MSLKNYYSSDVFMGRVSSANPAEATFKLCMLSGDEIQFRVSRSTWYEVLRNVGDESRDRVEEPSPTQIERLIGKREDAPDNLVWDSKRRIIKYLKPGVPGDISVRGRTKLGYAIFDIADNGRGIDPKDHQRIFDLFRRAGLQDRPGQGIGLAHVRALVRRLGGTMSVASELDKGSTFTVTIPMSWNINQRNMDP